MVVSLGAMSTGDSDSRLPAHFFQAFQETGIRAIIQGWNQVLGEMNLPDTVYHAGSIPHDWLLDRSQGFIHHGGFGSTAAGFRAGIPSLAIPHIIDQFLWGNKISELGVGPEPISAGKVDVDTLADALERMRSDQTMHEKAAELGEKMREENGVEKAVGLINEGMR